MKQNKSIQLAYLAGVIDSDGCISINKSKNRYHLQILVNSPDGRILDWCYGVFGGNRYFIKSSEYQENRMDVWRWEITCGKAAELCKKLIPFLRYKKQQAEVGYRFNCLIKRQNKNLPYRWERLTEKELEQREELYLELRKLKQIFVPCAVVETKRDKSSKDDMR